MSACHLSFTVLCKTLDSSVALRAGTEDGGQSKGSEISGVSYVNATEQLETLNSSSFSIISLYCISSCCLPKKHLFSGMSHLNVSLHHGNKTIREHYLYKIEVEVGGLLLLVLLFFFFCFVFFACFL